MMNNITDTVKHLIIINVIMFVGTLSIGGGTLFYNWFALHFPKNEAFQPWQIITHMFMHGGFMHIFFNMFALVSFGSALEQQWGSKKFLFFYISCGIGAMLLHTGVNYFEFHANYNYLIEHGVSVDGIQTLLQGGSINVNTTTDQVLMQNAINKMSMAYNVPAVGASGAIYGLLVAFAFLYPNAELALMFIPVPIKAKYFVPIILGIDLFLGLQGDSLFGGNGTGVAHFAHLGGALIGFLMMWYWKKNQFNQNRWDS